MDAPWWVRRLVRQQIEKLVEARQECGGAEPHAQGCAAMGLRSFMHVIGPVEMAVGAVILSGYTRPGGYVAAIWLGGIGIGLLTTGHYSDVSVREG